VNGSLDFFSKYLTIVPKSPPNTIELLKREYPSQLVMRVLRGIPWHERKPTQQMEHESNHKRANHEQNSKLKIRARNIRDCNSMKQGEHHTTTGGAALLTVAELMYA
jgi:isoleucyl-tRNA synthetase